MDEDKTVPEEKRPSTLRRVWDHVGYLVITALAVLVLFRVVFLLAYVPSGSMEPTMPTHSLFLASHLPYLAGDPVPERGDVVIFDSAEFGEVLVKRVIGLPGDTVSFSDGYVAVNGELLEEDYLPAQGITYPASEGDVFTVPEDAVFVMGDHRDDSNDGRFWVSPYVPLSDLQGRALVGAAFLPGSAWKGVHLL